MKTKNKAYVVYQDGLVLQIPKKGFAPMLFLEFLHGTETSVSTVRDIPANDVFYIRLNQPKEFYEKCAYYINQNI